MCVRTEAFCIHVFVLIPKMCVRKLRLIGLNIQNNVFTRIFAIHVKKHVYKGSIEKL